MNISKIEYKNIKDYKAEGNEISMLIGQIWSNTISFSEPN